MITVKQQVATYLVVLSAFLIAGCSSGSSSGSGASEDASTSGVAAGTVGGALASSDQSGTVTMMSGGLCPTILTNGSACTANSATNLDLAYNDCQFISTGATWNGTHEVSISAGSMACGTWPTLTAGNGTINRQFITTSNPGSVTRTATSGRVQVIDNASANLSNFDASDATTDSTYFPTMITPFGSGTEGYGSQVHFTSGARDKVILEERIVGYTDSSQTTKTFDHSVTTGAAGIALSESGTTRTVNGSLRVYHNLLKVIGTSSFTNVVYNNTCCTPVSGTITTSFTRGVNAPTVAGLALVGKSESLQFTACGSGSYTNSAGITSTVSINHCY